MGDGNGFGAEGGVERFGSGGLVQEGEAVEDLRLVALPESGDGFLRGGLRGEST